MATRRVRVTYTIRGLGWASRDTHTREWGLAPDATLTEHELTAILAAVNDVPLSAINILTATTYHKVDDTPPL
jgi:hypothetical protein